MLGGHQENQLLGLEYDLVELPCAGQGCGEREVGAALPDVVEQFLVRTLHQRELHLRMLAAEGPQLVGDTALPHRVQERQHHPTAFGVGLLLGLTEARGQLGHRPARGVGEARAGAGEPHSAPLGYEERRAQLASESAASQRLAVGCGTPAAAAALRQVAVRAPARTAVPPWRQLRQRCRLAHIGHPAHPLLRWSTRIHSQTNQYCSHSRIGRIDRGAS